MNTSEVISLSSPDDSNSNSFGAYTFFDSETWGIFYGYNQIVIILTILISSYFLSKNVQLYFECYKFLKDIYNIFGYICISINGLKKKYKYKNNSKKLESYLKVKNITILMVLNTIDVKCDEIIQLVEKIRKYFKNKAIKIIGNEILAQKDIIYSNSISQPEVDENMMSKVIELGNDIDNSGDDDVATKTVGKQEIMLEDFKIGTDKKKKKAQEEDEDEKSSKNVISKELDPVIVNYVLNEMCKYDIIKNKKDGFKKFLGILWDIRKIMFIAFSHVFDTASDVALAIEWYILYQKQ